MFICDWFSYKIEQSASQSIEISIIIFPHWLKSHNICYNALKHFYLPTDFMIFICLIYLFY